MLMIPEGDKRPLPLLVASQWSFPLAHIDTNGDPDHYLYCARDWFIGLGGEKSGWSKFDKSRLISIQPVETKRGNGKTESLEFVSAEDLYRIAANMRTMEKRPQLADIKQYLARAGVFVDQARREPEKVAEKLLARAKGIQARNVFTAIAQETHHNHTPNYAALTNETYEALFDATKSELVQQLGLSKAEASRFRDSLGELALKALGLAESAAATKMQQEGRGLTHEEQLEIVRVCSRFVAPAFHAMIAYLGVDNLTNRPLPPPRKEHDYD
jgi:hypothetical protein